MPVDVNLQNTRQALEEERLRIQTEINAYPVPIPACDAGVSNFNDLLERRSRICGALDALRRSDPSC